MMMAERGNGGDYPLAHRSFKSPSPSPPLSACGGLTYIEHPVSKFDTLAGIAIKYGVEVGDIKRTNGLMTDYQMFALKSLYIPLPGRYPPSPPIYSNQHQDRGSCMSEHNRTHSDLFESMKLKPCNVSPAMSSLQGYYGLKQTDEEKARLKEMAGYGESSANYIEDASSSSLHNLNRQRECNSSVNSFIDASATGNWIERLLIRRRQKSEADFGYHTPERVVLKDDDDNGSGSRFSASIGTTGLAQRSSGSRKSVSSMAEAKAEAGRVNPIPFAFDALDGVRKSSSASDLEDSDSGSSSGSRSNSKWRMKTRDRMQSLAGGAPNHNTRPIFDGIMLKPLTGRRNKAAID